MARHTLHSTFFANKSLTLSHPPTASASATVLAAESDQASEMNAQVPQFPSHQPPVAVAGGDRDVEMST